MAQSFGNSYTLVEVTPDDLVPEPKRQMWLAHAKPSQAVTLVLAAVPEGWTAEVVPEKLTDQQLKRFGKINLKPGDVYRLTSL